MLQQRCRIRMIEVPVGEFNLGAVKDIAIALAALLARDPVPVEVVDIVDPLNEHCQTLETVSQFERDRIAFQTADLLEIGELRDFHPVAPDFPAEAPGSESGRFPVIFDKTDVVGGGIKADRGKAAKIEFLRVWRRRLEDRLELVIVLEPVRILAETSVCRAARRLNIGGAPVVVGPERAQCRRRVKRAGADLHVIGLENHSTLAGPIGLQLEKD